MRRRIDPNRRSRCPRCLVVAMLVFAASCAPPGLTPPANPPASDLFAALDAQGEMGLVQSYRQGLQAREGVSAISIPTFAFAVDVPEGGELRAGYTVADRDWPNATTKSTFSILVRDGDRPVTSLHRGTIGETGESPPDDWIDVVADLAPWAGRRVDIVMQVERAPKTPGAAPLAYREGVPVWSRAVVQSRVAPKVMNVLWITIDTLRHTQVGTYGYAKPTTPQIDTWAQKGIVFTQAIAQSPWTRT
ncbi:MAG: sulfatase-like hydrolase/transferase, partial [Deltaproteobacteria bacterium]|nr:sulfatase-like hydrolase/transferase [Deltaproteobacteria bacterium]